MADNNPQRDAIPLGTDPAAWAAMVEATADAQRQPGFLLVLGTQAQLPSEKRLAAFAQAFGLDVFTARQWLMAPCPRLIKRHERHTRILEWVDWLAALGIRSYDLPEVLMAEQQFATVVAFSEDLDRLTFELDNGAREVLPRSQVSCLVSGEVSEVFAMERVAKGLTGEFVAEADKTTRRTEVLIDLQPTTGGRAYRLGQDTFRWSSLFPGETGQSLMLAKRLLKQLEQGLPMAPLHQSFGRSESMLAPSRQLVSSSGYLRERWFRPGARLTVERAQTWRESSRPSFDLYSTLLRWETIRIGPARPRS